MTAFYGEMVGSLFMKDKGIDVSGHVHERENIFVLEECILEERKWVYADMFQGRHVILKILKIQSIAKSLAYYVYNFV